MKKNILIFLVLLIVVGVYLVRKRIIKERVKNLLVYTACDQGELDNYFNIDHVHNSPIIFKRMKKNFAKFKVKKHHLAGFGKQSKKDVFNLSRSIGRDIYNQCGTPIRTEEQARMFVSLMIRTALN
ncbi:hypothetical protein BVX98_03845 [bacterium F11]|nr:hypothetical protein BVX98_03845 [bacterium F11]